jgi:hypothetical protein
VILAILPKTTVSFNTTPTKTAMLFFTEIEKTIIKFIWEHKNPE